MTLRQCCCVGLVGIGLLLSAFLPAAQRNLIQIKGSDTMVNLVQILAEAYMAKNPRAPIAILGGGSGTGVAALINGTCDLANLSREMSEKEFQLAKKKGIEPRLFAIAVDGLSVVVNGRNPLNILIVEQIGAIFRGEIRNWKDIGGEDRPITLYGRQSNSGTYVFFQEFVLMNQDYSAEMMQMNGNAQIIEGILQDRAGIGYVGVGYVVDPKSGEVRNGLKVLSVAADKGEAAYSPLDRSAVNNGQYPISRPLYQATKGRPEGAVLNFLRFVIGPKGQKIVQEEGFFPISAVQRTENEKYMK